MYFFVNFLVAAYLVLAAGVASAQSDYHIRSGDILSVEVFEDPSLNRSVVVLPDGNISFPFSGTIRAAGLTVPELRAALTNGIRQNFNATPNVFVGVQPAERAPAPVAQPAPKPVISVYVMGEVQSAGRIEVSPGTTFLQLLAQAGGLTSFAATKRIQLRRTDLATYAERVYTINYRALAQGASMSKGIRLQEGDVVLVPERRLFE